MSVHVRRTRGCERPFTAEQVVATGGQLAFTAATYTLFGVYVDAPEIVIPVVLYTIPVVSLLAMWAYCIIVDPALPGGFPVARMKFTQDKDRYCRLCGKMIPGLDHHCGWLNTCIGRRNYWAFFLLAIFGVLQHTLEIIFGICTATVWRGDGGAGTIVFAAIVCVLGCVGVGAFGSLWVFHLHLLRIGRGTYDWLIQRAESTPHGPSGTPDAVEHTVHQSTRGRKVDNEAKLVPSGPISSLIESNSQQAPATLAPDIEDGADLSLQEEADELQAGIDALRSRKLFEKFGEQLGAVGPHALEETAGESPAEFTAGLTEAPEAACDTSINVIVDERMDIVAASSTGESDMFPPSYYESKHAESEDAP